MPDFSNLKGLKASDRTKEEKKAINEQMGYNKPIDNIEINPITSPDTSSAATLDTLLSYQQQAKSKYQDTLEERNQFYNVDNANVVNTYANTQLDNIANTISSHYKKYKGTDKLPLTDQDKKQLLAEYEARKATYGEDNANIWLDKQFKEKVAGNQSWLEQGWHAISHLIPAIEGGAIQAFGNVYGAVNYVMGNEPEGQSEDLNWWDGLWDAAMDNPITRYGRDVEMAGASNVVQGFTNLIGLNDETASERIAAMKASATRYNPEGIGADAIITTEDQDNSFISTATPWQALQSGGFTALSMLVGAGEAKLAGWLFNGAAKGAMWMNSTGRALKTTEALTKALTGIKRAENFTNTFVIPAAVGTMEGAVEGLSTKIEVQREAIKDVDDYFISKVEEEAAATGQDFMEVWDKYQDEYAEARRQVDWAASKAGIHNFYINSLINGAMNQTLKAGIMAPRVQETLRNSRMFGWLYKNPKFNVASDYTVTAKALSKAEVIANVLKEPLGEGLEEYFQTVSSNVTSAAAENNVQEFLKRKFDNDGLIKVGESFGSDWAAALTALTGSLTDKESIQSAILGAVSSTMGTVGGIGTGYRRDEKGNLVRNRWYQNFTRSLNKNGEQESIFEYIKRVAPWRSGAVNAYNDIQREHAEAEEAAVALTEWLKDPKNRAKWDGLQGTANWMTAMEDAAESNDQFSYRKAQLGKAINDVIMLKKLEGTEFYNSVIADLQKAANGNVSEEEIAALKQNGGEEYQYVSNQEIVEKIQSNANKMLGLMSKVEKESKELDRMLGRIDEDTKQAIIFGNISEESFRERKQKLQEEIDSIKSDISNSTSSNANSISDDAKKLIVKYGSLSEAVKTESDLQEKKEKLEKQIKELKAIDSKKLSDEQKETLAKNEKELKKTNKKLEEFKGIRNEEGEIDSGLAQLVLNEQDIMNLDPITRALMLAKGATKFYNATHQNLQTVDQLNLEIDEINHQIDELEAQKSRWTKNGSSIKKGHNKQYKRNNDKIADLKKQKEAKMRLLDAEQGKLNTKSIYSSAQQDVIDNLIQQGIAQDRDFLSKLVDIGRLDVAIKDHHKIYQAILSDPKLFQNYVLRARDNAKRDLAKRRAERIAGIDDFEEYSQELDKLISNASEQEMRDIFDVLRRHDRKQRTDAFESTGEEPTNTNFQRFMDNSHKQQELLMQFAKNPNLTDNDQTLLLDAMQYLASKGVDVTDREAAVAALIEPDEEGNQGGKFRQFVEAKNNSVSPQQRAFMPVFTTIGQIVSQYVDLINGQVEDAINRGNINPTFEPATGTGTQPDSADNNNPASPISPQPQGPIPGEQFVDGGGTISTGAMTQSMQQRQQEENNEPQNEIEAAFQEVTSVELAKTISKAEDIINNANTDDDSKTLAKEYLIDLATNGSTKYSILDEVLTDLQDQISRLRTIANQQEEKDNKFHNAADILQKLYGLLDAEKRRGKAREPRPLVTRNYQQKLGWILSADIEWMASRNPSAWAVTFTNEHDIDNWNWDHYPIDKNTPVYFITDSAWTVEVMEQMDGTGDNRKRNYDTLTNMPVVAAVEVEAPQNPNKTTAIEVNGKWYQPICVMPSTNSKVPGSFMTREIRKRASQEQGRHLVTDTGLPDGNPLTTRVYGANYLKAHMAGSTSQTRRNNSPENNRDVLNLMVTDEAAKRYSVEESDRLRSLSKEELLNDPVYQEIVGRFIQELQYMTDGPLKDQIALVPDNHREGEEGSPMLILRKNMAETTGRTSDKTLLEVLENGTDEELVSFNSRTQRLFDEVIRPLFIYLPNKDRTGDKSARIITQKDLDENPNAFQDEADRLTDILNGKHARGVNNFVWINPKSGWELKVTASSQTEQTIGSDITTSESVYNVFFVNKNDPNSYVELGEIRVNANSNNNPDTYKTVVNVLRNLLFDGQQVRDFLNWQVPKSDVQNIKNPDKVEAERAQRNIAAITSDGILTIAGDALSYNRDGIQLYAPVSIIDENHTRVIYPSNTVTNSDNANTGTPQNITQQGEGAVNTKEGGQVLGDSGAELQDENNGSPSLSSSLPKESEALRKAKEKANQIIESSKQFELVDDDSGSYYVTPTGEKYLRVTTVIGADNALPELTEEEAKRRRIDSYVWTPTIRQIYDRLKQRFSLQDLTDSQLNTFTNIDKMSKDTGVSVEDIQRAVAELRTEHKKEKYGNWGTPSTSIGNTFDSMTRDFLAGQLKDSYPNVTKEVQEVFVRQLELFKNDLDSRDITIVSEGIIAPGSITMTDKNGNSHDVKVAGTLDLFGYDQNGNFYIFDMKTTRDHSTNKLEKEKNKWAKQISMYADLLKQTYGIEIAPENLRIIPINVDYPAPEEYNRATRKMLPVKDYRENKETKQLQISDHGKDEYEDFKMTKPSKQHESNGDNAVGMRRTSLNGQFQPGYVKFDINWDNLSSEDQDIASNLIAQTEGAIPIDTPTSATVETPKKPGSSFIDEGDYGFDDEMEVPPPMPTVTANGTTPMLPKWKDLSKDIKAYLASDLVIETANDYNDYISDPSLAEALLQDLHCRGLM